MKLQSLLPASLLALLLLFPARLPAQDTDGDGMPDTYELSFPCLLPAVADDDADYDADLLTSLEEYLYSPTLDPCAADTDGDGVTDAIESELGADPADPTITPQLLDATTIVEKGFLLQIHWTGSEYLAVSTICLAGPWRCEFNYEEQPHSVSISRYDRLGRLIARKHGLQKIYGYAPASFWNDNLWLNFVINREFDVQASIFSPHGAPITTGINDLRIRKTFWTGSDVGVFNFAWHFLRYDKKGNLIEAALFDNQVYRDVAWTGSEYGAITGMGNFRRLSREGRIIEEKDLFVGVPNNIKLTWTGSEFLMYGTGSRNPDASQCPRWNDKWCIINSSINRLTPSGDLLTCATASFPSINELYLNSDLGLYPFIWTGSYIGLITPERGAFDGYNYATDYWLHWLMPDGREITPPIQIPATYLLPAENNPPDFVYVFYNESLKQKVIFKLDPDSDGDGLSDTIESEGCLSPRDFDTDDDGIIDSLEDPDGDQLTGGDDLFPCTAKHLGGSRGGGSGGGGGCSLTAAGRGIGMEVGFFLPLLLVLGLARARKRILYRRPPGLH